MTSKEWEDICISFDEYGMQPATLCDNEEQVINHFREAFKNVLKDLEILEMLKKMIKFNEGNFCDYIFISFPQKSKEKKIIKEWLDERKK